MISKRILIPSFVRIIYDGTSEIKTLFILNTEASKGCPRE
jgi:hypothetical protein